MLAARPRLLIIDDDVARRLEYTSALAGRFDAWPLADGEDPLRAARVRRPDLALVALSRRDVEAGLRLVRTLRTDTRPVPRVGVLEAGPRPRGAFVCMELWMADGWLGLPATGAEVVEFALAVHQGERPVRTGATEGGGRLARLVSRVRGR